MGSEAPAADVMEYAETVKQQDEEKVKNKNLDDWLPITSSLNASGTTRRSTTSRPWSAPACSGSPSPCRSSDGNNPSLFLLLSFFLSQ
jgi:hypothetical protein